MWYMRLSIVPISLTFSSISMSITCWMALPTNCVLCVTRQMVPNALLLVQFFAIVKFGR